MRLAPNTDTVPASVNKYLLPHERQVISVHEHPAVLIGPIALVLLGLAIAGLLSNTVTHGNSTAILIIWGLWVVLLTNAVHAGRDATAVQALRRAVHEAVTATPP